MLSGLNNLLTSTKSLPKPGAVTWVSLGMMLFFWWVASQWASVHLVSEAKSEASVAVSLRANTISAGLNRQLALLDGLYAYVITEPSERDLQDKYIVFAEALSAHATGVRNIVTAPGGVMQFVYPIEGNENVVGYSPLHDSRQLIREDVEWAIENRRIVISGPVELVQGGMGIIARMPVFKNDEFWGLANIVLDLDPIIESAQFDLQSDSMSYAIREEKGHVFFGEAALFDNDPVISRVVLPEGYWELAAVPTGGWVSSIRNELRLFQLAGMAITGLLTGLIYLSNFRQNELERAVAERTIEISNINQQLELELVERREVEAGLRERESQYRSIYESVSDGLFINSLEGKLVDFNPTAALMHGYTVEEFKDIQPSDFIHPDSLVMFSEYIELARQGVEFRARAVDIKKDGTQFPVEVFGVPFTYRGEMHSLAVLRDITEQIEAYQRLEKRVEERTHELESLLNASQTLTSTLDLEALLGLILDQLKTIVDYEGASIFGFDDEGLNMKVYIGPIDFTDQERLPKLIQITCSNTAFSKREPLVYDDIHQVKEIHTEINMTQNAARASGFSHITSLMCIPLMVKDKLTGVLALHHSQSGYFQLSQGTLTVAFANQAAIAIENANLYRQAQSLAALEERQKLARELHDSVSQALYGIALGARTVRTILDRRSTDDNELIGPADYILSLAEAGLAEMRALIFELRPESLEMEGLVAALEKQAASITARHPIQVQTSFTSEPTLSIEVKEALYRISQEAMQNIIKHAKADSVQILLDQRNGRVVLEIQDNGIGFDPGRSFPGHLGLLSMKERVKKAGGDLGISSSPGRGTVVTASIKVEKPSR